MRERIVFSPEAEQDSVDAYAWYEGISPGLGEDFLRCIEAVLPTIERDPQIFPIAETPFRHAPIRRFPFRLFYAPHGEQIVIYAVFHCSQHPDRWRLRLPDDAG